MKNAPNLLFICLTLGLSPFVSAGSLLDKTIVSIECKTGETVSKGSGVLVSDRGLVLTAKHVVPDERGTVCFGYIGNANPAKEKMIIGRKHSVYDAQLLQFSGKVDLPYLRYCKLEDAMQRETIFATGFPGNTTTGVPSSRVGVLATIQPGGDGLIETDSETARGMSGGMVTLAGSEGLVGIIAGAKTDPGNGLPDYYGVLAAELIAKEFDLQEQSRPCSRVASLAGQTEEVRWSAGDGPRRLGMKQGKGLCFLTGVWGVFSDAGDSVRIEVEKESSEFVLMGTEVGGGQHGAYARCVPF